MDEAIRNHLFNLAAGRSARLVAAFWPFDGEPDLAPLLATFRSRGIRVGLPVIHERPGRPDMVFREWTRSGGMIDNRYGIPEPQGTVEIRVLEFDLMLLPLVGWDRSGGRLGMGAGYYDRALQPFVDSARPLRVGIGYDCQRVQVLPPEPWDIRLHGMVTENGWLDCTG
jgi:5-formyltetrahydrofolate cyclo-ligase